MINQKDQQLTIACTCLRLSLIKYVFICFLCTFLSVAADPLVIGIAGGSGAGKTTIVQELKKKLSNEVVTVYMDNYYCDFSHLPLEERQKINFDDPGAIDLGLLKKHIMQLKKGGLVEQPSYNFKTKMRSNETIHTKPEKIILIDGFLLLALPEVRDLCDLKIFIEVKETERLFRIIDRGQIDRGFSLQEIKQRYVDFIQPCYKKYISDSKYEADLIIPNGLDNKRAFQILLHLIKDCSGSLR